MAYLRIGEDASLAGLGCGPGCSCGSCRRSQFSGLGERYIRDEDFFRPPETPGPPQPPEPSPVYGPPPMPGGFPPYAPPGPFPPGAEVPPSGPSGVTVTPSTTAQLGDYGWTV